MVGIKPPSLPKIWRFSSAHFQRRIIFETNNLWYNVLEGIQNRIGATVDTTDQESSHLSSNTAEALSRNSFFQLRSRFGWMLFSVARVLRSFSPLSSSITRSDLNLALKFLLCLDMIMDPFFHTGLSISDSLKTVRKSVLIYETIIYCQVYLQHL